MIIVGVWCFFGGVNKAGNVYIDWKIQVIVALMCALCSGLVIYTITLMQNLIYLKKSITTGRGLWIFVLVFTLQALALIAFLASGLIEVMFVAGLCTFTTNVFLGERLVFLTKPCQKTKCPISCNNDLDIGTRIMVD